VSSPLASVHCSGLHARGTGVDELLFSASPLKKDKNIIYSETRWDGTVQCTPIVCPSVSCSRPEKKPGHCCATCPDCIYYENTFLDGQQFTNPDNKCQECGCQGGQVTCADRGCPGPQCSYPLPGTCCNNNCNGKIGVYQGWEVNDHWRL
ncbi:hypothetical protein AB205_0049080, partial [Aquarana catesbeiana]